MEFIPRIVDPAHLRLKVPNLYEAGKAYQPSRLSTFLYYPHHEGFNLQQVLEGDFHGKTWRQAASFVQRWAYWGMILEVFHIGGLLGLEQLAGQNDSEDTIENFSKCLSFFLYTWQCIKTDSRNPKAAEIESKRYMDIILILARVNAFYTRLCSQESRNLAELNEAKKAENGAAQSRCEAHHIYEKHIHPFHDGDRVDYDEYVMGWNAKNTFYNGEPYAEGNVLDSPGHALILSIGVAGELLSQAVERRFERGIPNFRWQLPMTLVRRLHLAGWCPVWMRKLRDKGSVARAYYLSSIPREPKDMHAHCCPFGCIANQVRKQTYQAKHAIENCNCEMTSFDLDETSDYAQWIRDGYSPLIVRAHNKSTSQVRWKLIRSYDAGSTKAKRYVAMSHVWADGTGSVSGNCLPACQLEKFHNGAAELYKKHESDQNDNDSSNKEPIPFWVDTICVPFHQGPLKMLAIQKMEQIYLDAEKVLVFDKSLQKFSLHNPPNECLTQIEISSWNERLWTIQEAAFAAELHFQFKDGITSVRELQVRYRADRFATFSNLQAQLEEADDPGPPLLKITLDSLLSPLSDKHVFSKPPEDFELRDLKLDSIFFGTSEAVSSFIYTLQLPLEGSMSAQAKWNFLDKVLPYRQTSIVADEGLCLSTLLGMDLNTLYKLPDEERIRRMFLQIGTINSGILFTSRPRVEKPGYRWMPSTFVTQRLERSRRTAEVTKEGIKVKLPGLFVKFPPKGFMSTIDLGEREKRFGFLECSDDSDDDQGPKHLVGASFPMHIQGSDRVFIVDTHLPKDAGGFIASGSAVRLVLEAELVEKELPEIEKDPLARIWEEWKQLQKKAFVEAFLVEDDMQNRRAVQYTVSATISELKGLTREQLKASAVATPLGEVEWFIS
jgi:hypothetical protein